MYRVYFQSIPPWRAYYPPTLGNLFLLIGNQLPLQFPFFLDYPPHLARFHPGMGFAPFLVQVPLREEVFCTNRIYLALFL